MFVILVNVSLSSIDDGIPVTDISASFFCFPLKVCSSGSLSAVILSFLTIIF